MTSSTEPLAFEGVELTETSLAEVLYGLSRYPPNPMAPPASGSGHRRAGSLADLVSGTPLEPAFHAAIRGLWTGDLNCAWLAAAFMSSGYGDPALVERAYRAAKNAAEEFSVGGPGAVERERTIRTTWARALLDGALPFSEDLRRELKVELDPKLLAAALVWDQDHTLDALPTLLANKAPSTLARALYCRLRVSEGRALSDALRRRGGEVFESYAQLVDKVIEEGSLLDEGPPRWQAPGAS